MRLTSPQMGRRPWIRSSRPAVMVHLTPTTEPRRAINVSTRPGQARVCHSPAVTRQYTIQLQACSPHLSDTNPRSVLFVYGSVNYDHQTYSVNLSPPAGASQGVRVFNATSKWFAFNSLIYWEVLDRNTTYSVSLKNLVSGKYLDIHQVRKLRYNTVTIFMILLSGCNDGRYSNVRILRCSKGVMLTVLFNRPSSSNGPSHSATASQSSPPAPTSSSAHSTTIPSTRAIVGIAVNQSLVMNGSSSSLTFKIANRLELLSYSPWCSSLLVSGANGGTIWLYPSLV